MKTTAFILAATTLSAFANPAIPQPHNAERYEETFADSPFVLATVEEKVNTAPEIKFTDNLYIVGVGTAKGEDFATLVRVGEEASPIRLSGRTAHDSGIVLEQVLWQEGYGKTKVRLRKGNETGEIGFNENAMKAAAPQIRPPGTNQPPLPGGNRPPGIPTSTGPQRNNPPGTIPNNGTIPRPPGNFQAPPNSIPRPPTSGTPTQPQPGRTDGSRQRIRVIDNR